MAKETSIHQIIRFDGKNVFVEVMDSAFEIGKVMMNFAEYDLSKPKGQRFTKQITIYMDINEFERLAHDIKFRFIDSLARKAKEQQKAGGYTYCKEVYADYGGTPRETLAKMGRARADNKDESRVFKITPGDRIPWILSAEKGAGKRLETGAITPDGKPDVFRKFAIVVDNEIQAWKVYNRVLLEREKAMRKKAKAS